MIRAALLCLCLATPAAAQDALATQTAAAAARLSEAEQLFAAAPHSDRPILTLAAAIWAYEDGLIAVRAGLRDTTTQYDRLQAELAANTARNGQLLAALQAGNQPVRPRRAFHPKGARATAQAHLLRTSLAPSLTAQADALREQLNHLTKAKALQETATETLQSGILGLEAAHAALREAFEDQPAPPQRFADAPDEVAELRAADLARGPFLAGLAAIYDRGLPNDAALASKGTLPLPATGRALPMEADATGFIVATPARALVVAPISGTLLYQGPLPGFDTAVVLEPTAGTLFVFAGLSDTFGTVGQISPAGWPLGVMSETATPSDANLTTEFASEPGSASQALYLEVRDGQTPVDPATWFAMEQ
ncbi:MAG: peptidase M23 [Pseudomonadota bacterium]